MPRWLDPRGTKLRIVAAEACGAVFGPTGTGPRRVVRLPTADSLCDRMERGEEEAPDRRRVAFRRSHFCRCEGGPLPTSGRRKFPSGNFRSARDFEGAKRVSRGQAFRQPEKSPSARRPPRTPPPPQPPQVRPRLLGIEECPHFVVTCTRFPQHSNSPIECDSKMSNVPISPRLDAIEEKLAHLEHAVSE